MKRRLLSLLMALALILGTLPVSALADENSEKPISPTFDNYGYQPEKTIYTGEAPENLLTLYLEATKLTPPDYGAVTWTLQAAPATGGEYKDTERTGACSPDGDVVVSYEKLAAGTYYYRLKVVNTVDGVSSDPSYSKPVTVTVIEGKHPNFTVSSTPMVLGEDGKSLTAANDIGTKIELGYSAQKPITSSYSGTLADVTPNSWDTAKYGFAGWLLTGEGEDVLLLNKADSNIDQGTGIWKDYVRHTSGGSWSIQTEYSKLGSADDPYYRYRLSISTDGQIEIQKAFTATPVFTVKPEARYTIAVSSENETYGKVTHARGDGESYTLSATPETYCFFDHWEQSTNGGTTWTAAEGGTTATFAVTLTQNTSFRAVFTPLKITAVENVKYGLPSTGNDWLITADVKFSQGMTDSVEVATKIYDGETINGNNLLGELNGTWNREYNSASSPLTQMSITARATKRPASNTGKVLLVVELSNGQTAQAVVELVGTMDVTPASETIETFDAYFFETIPKTLQLTATGDPEVGIVTWSGGWNSSGTASIDSSGLVSFDKFYTTRMVSFTAAAADGRRIAEANITFNSYNSKSGIKLNESSLEVPAGETTTYAAVQSGNRMTVDGYKVTATSSDESVFTAEILTRSETSWGASLSGIVDKIAITGVAPGEGTLTIQVGGMSYAKGSTWTCPVVITETGATLKSVSVPETASVKAAETVTLEAAYEPATVAGVTLQWSSDHPEIASVDADGVVTGVAAGTAVITVTATDANGNTAEARCTVTVTDAPYTVKVYVPKSAASGVTFYPTTGFDASGRDTFDTAAAISPVKDGSDTNYDIYTMTLQTGTYSFRGTGAAGKNVGGGVFTIPAQASDGGFQSRDNTRIDLRLLECYITNEFDGAKAAAGDFSVKAENKLGVSTVGDAYTNAGGYACYPVLAYVNGTALPYTIKAVPAADFAENCGVTEKSVSGQTYTAGTTAAAAAVTLPAAQQLTITAPAGASVFVGVPNGTQGVAASGLQPYGDPVTKDGASTYTYRVSAGAYEYRVSGSGYVTYCGVVSVSGSKSLTVTESQLRPAGKTSATLDRDPASNGGANMADIYLNINAQGHLRLNKGGTYQIRGMRNWWGSNQTWAMSAPYYIVEPDYHYTVLDLNGQPGSVVTVSDSGLLTAESEGTAIVLVTYDAMTLDDIGVLTSYDDYNPNGFFGAIWPENTGVFVVTVGTNDGNIDTGMTINEAINEGKTKVSGKAIDAELDVIYFLGEKGEYTFTPGTAGAAVSVANPAVSSEMSFSGFTAVSANADNSYTVPLTNGRNIVKVEKDGKAAYQVITAKQTSVKVNGVPLDQAAVSPGEKVSIEFSTLFNPVTRMQKYNTDAAAIYLEISGMPGKKAGSARDTYGYYFFPSTAAKHVVGHFVSEGSDSSGYSNPVVTVEGEFVLPADYAKENLTFSNGVFNVAGFGSGYGEHRLNEPMPGGMSPNSYAYLGRLPDITIPVGKLENISITTQPTKTNYNLGDVFDPAGMVITASYGNFQKAVEDYTFDQTAFSTPGSQSVTISYTHGGVTKTASVSVTVTEVSLERIEVTAPAKTQYRVGETFDPAGMVVTAVYSNGTKVPVSSYTCSPETITAADKTVTVTYGSKTAVVEIHTILVTAIAITTPPAKISYTAGNMFDPTGMVVTATYSDGTTAVTTDYSYPSGRLTAGDTAVVITYTGSDGAPSLASVSQKITVSGGSGNTPSEKSITVYISYSQEGKFVRGGEGTLLCNAPVSVVDTNKDGKYTIGEAFAALHEEYYPGGKSGYSEDTGNAGGWVNKFWGDASGNISYVLEHSWVFGSKTEISSGDRIGIFAYLDTSGYSDLYTWFDQTGYSATANTAKSFTVNGLNVMQSSDRQDVTAAPEGATVTVYDQSGKALGDLTTKTDGGGSFSVTFPSAGTYTIEVSGTCDYTCSGYGGGNSSYRNATVVPARCTVTVSASGSSSGGGAAAKPEDKTETVLKPGVITNAKGEASATVSEDTLKNSIADAKSEKADVIVIAPKVKGDTSKVSVELPKSGVDSIAKQISADLKVETGIADITIPQESLNDLVGQSGSKVTVSAESVKGAGTVRLEIAVDGKAVDKLSGGIAVSVPAGAEKAGNVLVLVNADGTETVVKKSAADGKTVAALLDGSCTVKVMDNAKTFNDTVSHWGKDAIAFASSHELFNGVSANAFAPNATMSRAMLATVLYRLEDAKADGTANFADVPSNTWYTEAVAWANENGIVKGTGDGFDPNGNVTREQLATMLYRYAQTVGMDTTTKGSLNKFSDNSKTSNWAQDAMSWAVGCGLISGKGSNTLDPTGSATRAEVATIMQRMVGLMVK